MKNTIYKKIMKNYSILYILTFFLTVIVLISLLTAGNSISTYDDDNYARTLSQDDYRYINIDFVTDHSGTAFIVDKNLDVITLCGSDSPKVDRFTMKEWTSYINKMDKENQDYNCSIYYNDEGEYWLVVKMPVAVNCAFYFNINTSKEVFKESALIISILVLICLFINFIYIAIYSKFTSRYFIKPLNMFENMIKSLEEGNYKERLDVNYNNEFGKLALSFNNLADCLEDEKRLRKQSEDNRKRLILDLSHDLKNPLTSTIGSLELCLNNERLGRESVNNKSANDKIIDNKGENYSSESLGNDKSLKHYIKMAYDNSLRANVLINELFEYSKLDSPDFKLKLEKTDVCEYMRLQIACEIDEIYEAQFLSEFDIPEKSIYALIDNVHFGRVIHNLILNTIKYNKENTKIEIKVFENNNDINIIIKDDGIGIDKKMQEDIFNVFVRDNKKSKTSGTGLGLTIAKKIVNLHNGDISLQTDINKGCIFTITIPKIS